MDFNDPLLNFATVLMSGIVGGELVARIRLPKVTGWIFTGIVLRYLELPGLGLEAGLANAGGLATVAAPYMNFVLGYIAFTVGAALHFASLRNARRRLAFLLLGEALVTPSIVLLVLLFVGRPYYPEHMSPAAALLLAAIAIAGAPGTTVLVVQESRARGILTRTLVAAVALIDMVAVGVFVFAASFLATENVGEALAAVGAEFGVTLAVGGCSAVIALAFTRTIVGPAFLGPTMVVVILASWGAAVGLNKSGILACSFAGLAVTNLRHESVRSAEAYLHSIGGVLFAAFYTLAGMKLNFGLVFPLIGLVLLFFGSRFLGKYVGAFAAMQIAGVTDRVRNYLGLALLPHGGVAVGLILLVETGFPAEASETVTTVGLAALAMNQLLGPSATRFSLAQAGEAGKDRARLLDFLDEHHITVAIKGTNKEEIVRSLAAQLYSTKWSPPIPQDEFIQKVLQREAEESTCLGEGLMIPHAILADGDDITGILGISSAGLDLDAPDGRPVHAVLLLATPRTDRRRHLEVLAAFASAITHNMSLAEQLYHARSAAHAYEVLHAEDAEDLNYFLEDAMERAGVREDT
jgi:mannitol/fructose-specific phosphotransferase system IIA component (Ntr-type)/Kef-type K+ transport system membrane component KefB